MKRICIRFFQKIAISICLSAIFSASFSNFSLSADTVTDHNTHQFDERRWSVTISPYVWAASLNGNAALAGYDMGIDVPFSQTFKHLEDNLMGNIEISNGLFGFSFDGQYTKTRQTAHIAAHSLDVGTSTTMISGAVFYRAYEAPLGGTTSWGTEQIFAFEPTVGIRWTRLSANIDAGPMHIERALEWTDPFLGARIHTDLSERWNLFAQADIGGFNTGTKLSANGQAYLGYRTLVFGQPTLLRAGYRAIYQDYRSTDFTGHQLKWDATEHGPVMGVSVNF